MKRTLFCVLGAGLLVLWVFGLTRAGMAGWVSAWLDALAAVWCFALAIAMENHTPSGRTNRQAAILCLSVGLFAVWGLGLAAGLIPRLVWWNFGFACAFLVAGILPDNEVRRHARVVPLRRSA